MISLRNPTWLSIAKTEYRVTTSRIREIRSYLPYLLIGGLTIYTLFIAPSIIDAFVDELHELLLSAVAVAIINVLFFVLFVMFASFPISSTIADIKTEHLEIYLSSPVQPSDILIGEFLGKIPFYAVFAAIIGGTFTAALFPLGLDIFQIFIIVTVFIIIFLSATWVGTMIAVLLRSVLMKSARGRDIGKGLAIIVILPLVAVIYLLIGGYYEVLKDPQNAKLVKDLFAFFPWGWGSEIIVAFAQNPGDILLTEFSTILQFSALIAFLGASLLIGGFLANRVYNLEPTSFSAATSNPNSLFYNSIRKLGGGGTSGLLLSTGFKTYFRKAKNIAWIIYSVGLIVVMNVFLTQPDDPESAFIMSLFIGPLLAAFVTSDISLQGKENLLLYKQTPTRTRKYLRIKLFQYFLTILPIVLAVETTVNLLVPNITLEMLFLNVILTVLIAAATITFTIGLFIVNPAFHDKSGEFMINIQICVFGVMIPFFILLILLDQILWDLFAIADALYPVAVIYTALQWVMGLTMLSLGAIKLNKME
ncbi:MAG: ABC transporter permease [Promethearchaeota archaeon]